MTDDGYNATMLRDAEVVFGGKASTLRAGTRVYCDHRGDGIARVLLFPGAPLAVIGDDAVQLDSDRDDG